MAAGTPTSPPDVGNETSDLDPRRWKSLMVLGLVQFILVLDVTVVNVALPRIQADLGFTHAGLAWVVNSYVIVAAGLLLLGGRLGDFFGRRRLFFVGVALFAVASLTSGMALSAEMLVISRFVQGAGEAMAAPAALGLIVLIFTDPAERAKALGIAGGIAGIAGISGVVLSGLVTEFISWRVLFLINVPIAIFAVLAVRKLVDESRMERNGQRLDVAGALTATLGLIALVYGLIEAAAAPWSAPQVVLPLVSGGALFGLLILIEHRTASPLIPRGFFANRTRVAANLTGLLYLSGFVTYTFMQTLYGQQVLGFTPLQSGLLAIPFGIVFGLGIGLGAALSAKLGVRMLLAGGYLLSGVGLLVASIITPDSTYLNGILPGQLIFGLAAGLVAPAIGQAAVHGVTKQDSGLASGIQQSVQQLGSALGLALLVTLALRSAADQTAGGVAQAAADTAGYALAFQIAAVVMVVASVLAFTLLGRVLTADELEAKEEADPPAPITG